MSTIPTTPARADAGHRAPHAGASASPRPPPSSSAASSASGSSTSRARWPATARSASSRWRSRPSAPWRSPTCSRRCRAGCPRTAGRTPTPASPSATPPASPTRGRTGSPHGPGNAAIVVGWVFYVQYVIEGWITARDGDVGWLGATVRRLGNGPADLARRVRHGRAVDPRRRSTCVGVKSMGSVQVWTSVIKFIPLVADVDHRPVRHHDRELQPDEPQRRQRRAGDPRRDGPVPVLLPRRRDRVGRRRQGAQSRRQRAAAPRSTAPWPPPRSTCSRSSPSSARSRPRCSVRAPRRTPPPPTR